MEDRELYNKTYQTELNGWKADLAEFKGRVLAEKNDEQITLNERIADLERKMLEAEEMLTALAEADEGLWASLKQKMDAAWLSTKATYQETVARFKE